MSARDVPCGGLASRSLVRATWRGTSQNSQLKACLRNPQPHVGGSASYLGVKQEDDLKAWVAAALPRSTRQIGAWIEKEFGLVYESRSGLIALLHRLGLEYHKPSVIPRKLDKEKQKAFIESYTLTH